MSAYKGREHIDGILAEGGMREQALIAAGEEHMADSRSMILLCREVRFLRAENASLAAKVKELEKDGCCCDADGHVCGQVETVAERERVLREALEVIAGRHDCPDEGSWPNDCSACFVDQELAAIPPEQGQEK